MTASDSSRWAPLPVVLAGTFLVVLDFFIVNVALPSMQADLGASDGAIEWVVAGYALTSAVLLITAGRLGDRHGRRRVFMAGIALFTVSSLACGLAPSAAVLVGARLVQGVAAAAIMPTVLSIIGVTYTGADRARALGAYGAVMGVAAVGGQLIGGALLTLDAAGIGWRGIFVINVPIGLCTLLAAGRLVPESRAPTGRPDLVGTVLVTLGLTATVLPLVEGRAHGWPVWAWVSLAAAPVLLGAFAVTQVRLARRGGTPLLRPALFCERAFSAGLVVQSAFWCGQASFFLVLALYLQQGRGLGALASGLVFTILAVPYLAASAKAPALADRFGRALVAEGALVLASGHALLLLAVTDVGVTGSVAVLAPGLVLAGTGMGLLIAPLTTIVMGAVGPEHAGAASGAMATMQNVGNATGVAVIGLLFFGAGPDLGHAFAVSVGALAVLLVGVAGLSRLLPARTASRR